MKTILVVDDEVRITSLVQAYLQQQGYRVLTARNGRDAVFVARHEKPDLIVLDVMMPEMDGLSALRLLRKEREVPVILLTARVEDDDKVLGLELGADDYVTKPFSPRELTARIRAVLRRAEQTATPTAILRVRDLALDRTAFRVFLREQAIEVTPSEFAILQTLLENPEKVFSRLELLERLPGGEAYEGYERTIDAHIKNIRAKIEDNPREPLYITTVYGVGYRLMERPST
ncbi:MAG TPA: response regulator transcription factor [Anaerolineales bacterium]|nr:response regulator transcription factor [Anaerolineales bacterium]